MARWTCPSCGAVWSTDAKVANVAMKRNIGMKPCDSCQSFVRRGYRP